MKFMTPNRILTLLGSFALAGALACDAGGTDVGTSPTNPNGPAAPGDGKTALAISFLTSGSTDTSCGVAAGVQVMISDGLGEQQSCNAEWAPVEADGQQVADCFFVLHSGRWQVDKVAVIDGGNQALSCCHGNWPSTVSVAESSTTEFGASFNCDTPSNGALDIFAKVNRPPQINDVNISPSKFGSSCSLITLDAAASDPDGDGVTYSWGVMDSPKGSDFAIESRGQIGYFVGSGIGTYQMRLVVSDDFSATHYLDFPIHLTEGGSCDPDAALQQLKPRP